MCCSCRGTPLKFQTEMLIGSVEKAAVPELLIPSAAESVLITKEGVPIVAQWEAI